MPCLRLWQGFYIAQGTPHGTAPDMGLVQGFQHRFGLGFNLGQNVTKFPELGFYGAQHLPNLAAAFLQCQCAKAHLQSTQHRQQRGGPSQRNAVIALQRLHQTRATQYFSVQAFAGQKQNRKVSGVRRRNIFVGYGLGFQPNPAFQGAPCCLCCCRISASLRVQ